MTTTFESMLQRGEYLAVRKTWLGSTEHDITPVRQGAAKQRFACTSAHDYSVAGCEFFEAFQVGADVIDEFIFEAYGSVCGYCHDNIYFHINGFVRVIQTLGPECADEEYSSQA